MNRREWADIESNTLDDYMTKLIEEVGEVARELSDMRKKKKPKSEAEVSLARRHRRKRLRKMQNELQHVLFIAEQMDRRAFLERHEVEVQIRDESRC